MRRLPHVRIVRDPVLIELGERLREAMRDLRDADALESERMIGRLCADLVLARMCVDELREDLQREQRRIAEMQAHNQTAMDEWRLALGPMTRVQDAMRRLNDV